MSTIIIITPPPPTKPKSGKTVVVSNSQFEFVDNKPTFFRILRISFAIIRAWFKV